MVRAPELKADKIITALEAGDFYASSGVTLADVIWKNTIPQRRKIRVKFWFARHAIYCNINNC